MPLEPSARRPWKSKRAIARELSRSGQASAVSGVRWYLRRQVVVPQVWMHIPKQEPVCPGERVETSGIDTPTERRDM